MNRVALLTIGDELLEGRTVDRNAATLARAFTDAGGVVIATESVGDDVTRIADSVRRLAAAASTVVLTGGLGPTPDDLTRAALAAAADCALVSDAAMEAAIEVLTRGHAPARNRLQAQRPAHARWLDNPVGSAPGLALEIGAATVYALPGVPREVAAMLPSVLDEWQARTSARPRARRTLSVIGVREADLVDRLGPLLARGVTPEVSVTVHSGVITVTVRGTGADERAAAIRAALGDDCFADDDTTLAGTVVLALRVRRATVAVAESLTGGMLASLFVDVAGASDVFAGGIVAYHDAFKTSLLDVPASILAQHTAVSEAAVRAMASGARQRFGADFALATSGAAGPEPDGPAAPGTGWIACAGPDGASTRALNMPGDRALVRRRFALAALDLLRRQLLADTP